MYNNRGHIPRNYIAGPISAFEFPIHDINPFDGEDGWTYQDWINWYFMNVEVYGELAAAEIWLGEWTQYSTFDWDSRHITFWSIAEWVDFIKAQPYLWAYFKENNIVQIRIAWHSTIQDVVQTGSEVLDFATGETASKTVRNVGLALGAVVLIAYAPSINRAIKKIL